MAISSPTFVPVTATLETATTVRLRFSLPVLNDATLTTASNYTIAGSTVSAAAAISNDLYGVMLTIDADSDVTSTHLVTVVGAVLDSTSTYAITAPGNTTYLRSVFTESSAAQPFIGRGGIAKAVALPKLNNGALPVTTKKTVSPAISVGSSHIVLTFPSDVTFNAFASQASNWTISSTTGTPVAISSVTYSSNTITLTVSEQTGGATYTLIIPNGVYMDDIAYSGVSILDFTGVYVNTTTVNSFFVDNNTIRVIFSNPVNSTDALIVANYSIDNGATVQSILKVSDNIYNLTTSRLHSSTTYTVTISNIRDLAGNPI